MKLGKYQTTILVAIKDLIKRPKSHPRRSFYHFTDGWITDPKQIIRAIRLDDELGIKSTPTKNIQGGKSL